MQKIHNAIRKMVKKIIIWYVKRNDIEAWYIPMDENTEIDLRVTRYFEKNGVKYCKTGTKLEKYNEQTKKWEYLKQ
jgi:hypothetical protein